MTGEMHSINQKGLDSNGESWPLHAAIARAVKGKLQPFDVYQGPYISVGADVRLGRPPYAVTPMHLGLIRLWVTEAAGQAGMLLSVYREDTDKLSDPFSWHDTRAACQAARQLLAN